MRRKLPLIVIAFTVLILAGCGGGSDVKDAKGDTSATKVDGDKPKLSEKSVELFFTAIASGDLERVKAVKKLTAPGSIAEAYAREQADALQASIDGGIPIEAETIKKVDGGWKGCPPDDASSCVVWGNPESVDGKLAKFTINNKDITGRISVGDGSKLNSGKLGEVEFLSAYKSVQSEYLFVNVAVTSKGQKVSIGSTQATYRGTDKRQVTAEETAGPTDLDADSTANVTMIFKTSGTGGVVKLELDSEDFMSTEEVTIKTK